MRTMALDMGDVWVGTAISDGLGLTCRPLRTVKRPELEAFLRDTFAEYGVEQVVVGLPTTMSGTESDQTRKTRAVFDRLQKFFSAQQWYLIDERLSSHQALEHQRDVKKQRRTPQSKQESHSIAAAFILQDFLRK